MGRGVVDSAPTLSPRLRPRSNRRHMLHGDSFFLYDQHTWNEVVPNKATDDLLSRSIYYCSLCTVVLRFTATSNSRLLRQKWHQQGFIDTTNTSICNRVSFVLSRFPANSAKHSPAHQEPQCNFATHAVTGRGPIVAALSAKMSHLTKTA